MLRVGIVGIGFMGMIHYLSYQKTRGVKVAALCETDPKKLAGDWRGIKGNFGPPGEKMDLTGIATYSELDDLLADDSIDVIDVTLPPALHADVVVKALKAGKHVFCEKPMAMSLTDCTRMQRAAEKADRQLLIGHVLPYTPEYAWALKEVRSGKHGRLLGGMFKRVISDPAWLTRFWSGSAVGGPLLDLHVHDAHFIRLLFGQPSALYSSGRMREDMDGGELPEFWNTQFEFETGESVLATCGTINQQGRTFQHAFEIHLEKATLMFDFAVIGDEGVSLCPPTILDARGKARQVKLADGDPLAGFAAEIKEVVRCVKNDTGSDILGAELARDAIQLCHQQAKSLKTGKRVKL